MNIKLSVSSQYQILPKTFKWFLKRNVETEENVDRYRVAHEFSLSLIVQVINFYYYKNIWHMVQN